MFIKALILTCLVAAVASECGNGVIDAGETCDDGNRFSHDGCSGICEIEDGYECDGTSCLPVLDDNCEFVTYSPTTTRRGRRTACPEYHACNCKPGAKAVEYRDERGCLTCSCVSATTQAPTTTHRETTTTEAPTTTRRRETTTTTEAMPTTTRDANGCKPQWSYCDCGEGEVAVPKINRKGCAACKCVANTAPTTTQAPTTRRETTTTTTEAPTTTRRETTTSSRFVCPTYTPCRCKPDAYSVNTFDENGCASCSCLRKDSVTPTTTRAASAQRLVAGAATNSAAASSGTSSALVATIVGVVVVVMLIVAAIVVSRKKQAARRAEETEQLEFDDSL